MTGLKIFFQILSLRERSLLCIFLWVSLFVWVIVLFKDLQALKSGYDATEVKLQSQEIWYEQVPVIDEGLVLAKQRLDPSKTYSSSQLVGKLDQIARGNGLNFDISSPKTQESDIYNEHTVRVQLKKAQISDIITFDRNLKLESPYLGLERVQITANKSDPRQLDAQFVISSFELKETSNF